MSDALTHLRGTTVRTYIQTGGVEQTRIFGLIDEANGGLRVCLEMRLSRIRTGLECEARDSSEGPARSPKCALSRISKQVLTTAPFPPHLVTTA